MEVACLTPFSDEEMEAQGTSDLRWPSRFLGSFVQAHTACSVVSWVGREIGDHVAQRTEGLGLFCSSLDS